MILIVGLGNPGPKYAKTRHNLGFTVVTHFVEKQLEAGKSEKCWKLDPKFKSEVCQIGPEIMVAKPQTFMNNSGLAVSLLLKLLSDLGDLGNLWVVHDDLDLPVGRLQIVKNRGAAGHRGVDSIIKALRKTDFVRFRLGIGGEEGFSPSIGNADEYVLQEFLPQQHSEVKKMIKKAVLAIEVALAKGIEAAMNRFNSK